MTDGELKLLRESLGDADRDGYGVKVGETDVRKLLARLEAVETGATPSAWCDGCAGQPGKVDCMCGGTGLASDAVVYLRERLLKAEEALDFYADPTTYFAVGFFPDPPAGAFMEDFSETELGLKPGKRARKALGDEE